MYLNYELLDFKTMTNEKLFQVLKLNNVDKHLITYSL